MTFVATHVVPDSGLTAWDRPDASLPGAAELTPGLEVQLASTLDDWAHIVCSNGWTTWVDGRRLIDRTTGVPAVARRGPAPAHAHAPASAPKGIELWGLRIRAALVGAVLVVLGPFLPWAAGATSFKVPVQFLVDDKSATSGFKIGYVLVLLGLAGGFLATREGVAVIRKIIGGAVVLIATMHTAQLQRAVRGAVAGQLFSVLGLGVYVALAGGVLLIVGRDSVVAS